MQKTIAVILMLIANNAVSQAVYNYTTTPQGYTCQVSVAKQSEATTITQAMNELSDMVLFKAEVDEIYYWQYIIEANRYSFITTNQEAIKELAVWTNKYLTISNPPCTN